MYGALGQRDRLKVLGKPRKLGSAPLPCTRQVQQMAHKELNEFSLLRGGLYVIWVNKLLILDTESV